MRYILNLSYHNLKKDGYRNPFTEEESKKIDEAIEKNKGIDFGDYKCDGFLIDDSLLEGKNYPEHSKAFWLYQDGKRRGFVVFENRTNEVLESDIPDLKYHKMQDLGGWDLLNKFQFVSNGEHIGNVDENLAFRDDDRKKKNKTNPGSTIISWGNLPRSMRLNKSFMTDMIMQNDHYISKNLDLIRKGIVNNVKGFCYVNGNLYFYKIDGDFNISFIDGFNIERKKNFNFKDKIYEHIGEDEETIRTLLSEIGIDGRGYSGSDGSSVGSSNEGNNKLGLVGNERIENKHGNSQIDREDNGSSNEKVKLINQLDGLYHQHTKHPKIVDTKEGSLIDSIIKEYIKLKFPDTKVVDKDGEPQVVYHGTNDATFTEFATGKGNNISWFTTNRIHAKTYAEYNKDWKEKAEPYVDDERLSPNGVYASYLNITNPLELGDIDKDCSSDNFKKIASAFGMKPEELIEHCRTMFDNPYNDISEIPIWQITNSPRFRTLLAKHGFDGVIAEEAGTKTFGVINKNQIKSAERITYDDNNNVIPLNERFNSEKDDIRFREGDESLDDLKERKRDLLLRKAEGEDVAKEIKEMERGPYTKVVLII